MRSKKIFFIVLFNSIFYNSLIYSSSPAAYSSDDTRQSFTVSTPLNNEQNISFSPSPLNPDGLETPLNKKGDKKKSLSSSSEKNKPKEIAAIDYILQKEPGIINKLKEAQDLFDNLKDITSDGFKKLTVTITTSCTSIRSYINNLLIKTDFNEAKTYFSNNFFNEIPTYKKLTDLQKKAEESFKEKELHKKQEKSYLNIKKINNATIKENFNSLSPDDYEFLKPFLDKNMQDKIKNSKDLLGKTKNYIYSAYCLYVDLNINKVLERFDSINEFYLDGEKYDITKWNLLHVFLGNLKNDKFTGLHSMHYESLLKGFYEKIIILKSPDENILDTMIFYKKDELYTKERSQSNSPIILSSSESPILKVDSTPKSTLSNKENSSKNAANIFVKRCTLFTNSINDIHGIINSALNNIKNQEPLNNVTILNTEASINTKNIKIIFLYDPKEKSINTFFPTFDGFKEYEADISENDYTKIITSHFSQFNNHTDMSYDHFIKTFLPDITNNMLSKKVEDSTKTKDEKLIPTPEEHANINYSEPLTEEDKKTIDDLIQKKSFDSFTTTESEKKEVQQEKQKQEQKESLKSQSKRSNLETPIGNSSSASTPLFSDNLTTSSNLESLEPKNFYQSQTSKKISYNDDDDQQGAINVQTKMGERTGTQPPSTRSQNHSQQLNNTPSKSLAFSSSPAASGGQ